MASVKENLIAAKALISTPDKWLQGDLRDEDFTCFCAIGAIETAGGYVGRAGTLFGSPEVAALTNASGFQHWSGLAGFNDDEATTHADIMDLFDRAIAAEGGQT